MNDMANHAQASVEELLVQAIRDCHTRPETCAFELGQLYGGIVQGNEQLEKVWDYETGPEMACAEIRFTGDGVHGHSMDAPAMSDILSGISDATSAVAKTRAEDIKKKQHSNPINISDVGKPLQISAIKPGSVVIELQAPERPPHEDASTSTPSLDYNEALLSLDDEALRTVLTALSSEDYDACIANLPTAARIGIHRVATIMSTQRIDAEISIRQRRHDTYRASTTSAHATVLLRVLEEPKETTTLDNAIFELDGWKNSENSVYLKKKNGKSHTYHADDKLIASIRTLPQDPTFSGWVQCTIEITQTESLGKKRQPASRKLLDAKSAPAPDTNFGDQASIDGI